MADEVSEWLSNINPKYAQYAPKLMAAGFDDVASCDCLTEPDLKEMDIPAGHARMIVRACNPGLPMTPTGMMSPQTPSRVAVLSAAREVAKMNEEHAHALMNEMSKLPSNPDNELARELSKAQKAAADAQLESSKQAVALATLMDDSRDKLRRSLKAVQAARNTVDGCRVSTEQVVANLGARGEPSPDSALGQAKKRISDKVEAIVVALRLREQQLHKQAQKWSETKCAQLESELDILNQVIAEQDASIAEGHATLSLEDWDMSVKLESTASRLDTAAALPFPSVPCVDTMLMCHLPETLADVVSCWGSCPGLCFNPENCHPTVQVSNENTVITMTSAQGVHRAALGEPVTSSHSSEPLYFEFVLEHTRSAAINVGVCKSTVSARGNPQQQPLGDTPDAWMFALCDQKVSHMGQKNNYGAKDWGVGDRVGLLIDFKSGGEITFYKNGILMEIGAKNIAFPGGSGCADGPVCPAVELLHQDDRVRIQPREPPQ